MNRDVEIWKEERKGREVYCAIACGKYGEFESQLEAANFADAVLDVEWRKENKNE